MWFQLSKENWEMFLDELDIKLYSSTIPWKPSIREAIPLVWYWWSQTFDLITFLVVAISETLHWQLPCPLSSVIHFLSSHCPAMSLSLCTPPLSSCSLCYRDIAILLGCLGTYYIGHFGLLIHCSPSASVSLILGMWTWVSTFDLIMFLL